MVCLHGPSEKKTNTARFCFHDPLLDLLHVLKTQEITTKIKRIKLIIRKGIKTRSGGIEQAFPVASANKTGCVHKTYGEIFWCNDSYLKLTGFAKEEIIGAY
jgi:hypothetical protein